MNYLSPFHILPKGFENKAVLDKKTLKQARKILLAEFELQGQTTIFINEQEYDKDAILKFFDELEKDANLEFHVIIFQNKSLLRFLEKGQIEDYESAAKYVSSKNYPSVEKFQQFVAPYFVTNYNNLLYNSLRANNKNDLFVLIDTSFPFSTEHESTAYQASYRWCHQQLRQAEKIEKDLEDGQFVSSKQVYELIDPSFIYNFNLLPNYFYDIRDKYAFKLYELIVLLNNKYKRVELARALLDAGILLKADEFTHKYYINADKIIDKKVKKKRSRNWLWIYLVAQFIFIVFKISTCNRSSTPSYDYKFNNISPELYIPNIIDSSLNNIGYNSFYDTAELDSLIKEIEKTLPTIDTIEYKPLINDDLLDSIKFESQNLDSVLNDLRERVLQNAMSKDSLNLLEEN
ncbi:MAG: hypothetical protein AB8G11_12950 [Saprospiraceae bacterium]